MDHMSEKWCTHSERSPPADTVIWEKWKLKWSPQDQVRNPLLLSERNPQRKHCTSLGCHFSDCIRAEARMILAYGQEEVSLSVVRSGRWSRSSMLPTAPEPDPQCFANLVLIWSGPKTEKPMAATLAVVSQHYAGENIQSNALPWFLFTLKCPMHRLCLDLQV